MDFIKLAGDIGFEGISPLELSALCVKGEVREMCAADKCKKYGTNWACPPACGSIEHCRNRIAQYTGGILVQTVGALDDEFDMEGIARAHELHSRRFETLARQVRRCVPDCLPLSAGACTRCAACTYPHKPCRFPKKMFSSMEAYGLLVSEVCEKSGLPYYRGEKTITFTSCILIKEQQLHYMIKETNE